MKDVVWNIIAFPIEKNVQTFFFSISDDLVFKQAKPGISFVAGIISHISDQEFKDKTKSNSSEGQTFVPSVELPLALRSNLPCHVRFK